MATIAKTAWNLLVSRRHPVSLIHFVTNKCNARCSHCFLDFGGETQPAQAGKFPLILQANPRQRPPELTLEEIERVAQNSGPCLTNVNLTGGEPFLRMDIGAIADAWFRHASIRTLFVTTHGGFPQFVLPFAEKLAKTYPDRRLIFSISLDHFRDEHDRYRRVKGLFDRALHTYRELGKIAPNVMATAAMTISEVNCDVVNDIYDHFVDELGIRALTVGATRNQGVYHTPPAHREKIHAAYFQLSERLDADMRSGRLEGYRRATLAGRLLNAKNRIVRRPLAQTMRTGRYVSPCHAGAVFGVLGEAGDVFPCEILNHPYGNVRDYDCNLLALWNAAAARTSRRWIRKTNCRCDYDCAWTFNILCNWRYQPQLLLGALGVRL